MDSEDPEATAKALDADNQKSEGLELETSAEDQVVSRIKTDRITTLISTLDDLVACHKTAEKVISNG